MSFRCTTMWAFLSIDEDDDEGVIAVRMPNGWMPLVAADEKRLEDLRPFVTHAVADSGRTVRLARFTVREDVEVIGPAEPVTPPGN
jgi:hypothetical protein